MGAFLPEDITSAQLVPEVGVGDTRNTGAFDVQGYIAVIMPNYKVMCVCLKNPHVLYKNAFLIKMWSRTHCRQYCPPEFCLLPLAE